MNQQSGQPAKQKMNDTNEGQSRQDETRILSEGAPGENRKPGDPIGEVAHAEDKKKE